MKEMGKGKRKEDEESRLWDWETQDSGVVNWH